MQVFSGYISEKYSISENVSSLICNHYELNDSPCYLANYSPEVCNETDLFQVLECYLELDRIKELEPKRNKLLKVLEHNEVDDEEILEAAEYSVDSYELDELMLPFISKPRSKASIARKKGLEPLADVIEEQEIEGGDFEEVAKEYLPEDLINEDMEKIRAGVHDILVESFSYDTGARQMLRDMGYEEGYVEVTPRRKNSKKFASYKNRMIPIHDMDDLELLRLREAEQKKEIRFKINVNLFQVIELLKHHFIVNHDAVGIELINEAIDTAWNKSLKPMMEKATKEHFFSMIDHRNTVKLLRSMDDDIEEGCKRASPAISLCLNGPQEIIMVTLSTDGSFLASSKDDIRVEDRPFSSSRLRKLRARYHPSRFVVPEGEEGEFITEILKLTVKEDFDKFEIVSGSLKDADALTGSDWMDNKNSDLEPEIKRAYSLGLSTIKYYPLIAAIGPEYFNFGEMWSLLSPEVISKYLKVQVTEKLLWRGVQPSDLSKSAVADMRGIDINTLYKIDTELRSRKIKKISDLLYIESVDDGLYRNISGFIVIKNAENPLDSTLVHPDHAQWIYDAAEKFEVSLDSIFEDPVILKEYVAEDDVKRVFTQKKLVHQLKTGVKRLKSGARKVKKRQINELSEGAILAGVVTNVTKFGAFVDINAESDGLIHISQFKDGYVEKASDVVTPGQRVDVRVIKIDQEKKRISLSMKGVRQIRAEGGEEKPPSKEQLSSLADRFNKSL